MENYLEIETDRYINDRCMVSEDGVFFYAGEDIISRSDVMRFIEENERLATNWRKYRHYYKSQAEGIIRADAKPNDKPDNRLINNYAKKLIDTYTGFAVGKPIQITLQEDVANTSLSEFNRARSMDTLFTKLWKQSAIYGKTYAYIYGANQEIYVTDAPPTECFVIYDSTVAHNPLYAVRYSKIGLAGRYSITLYSARYQYEFNSGDNNNSLGNRTVNPFGLLPIVEIKENDERLSVIANVITLIDELDKALSEKSNDVDYFADAYMKVLGALLNDEALKKLRDYRIINLKSSDSEDDPVEQLDVDFLSKPNADTTQENLINRIIDNLYQLSMIVNLNDKDFGNSTGVALEMKYKPMLNLSVLKARAFSTSIKSIYEVVFSSDLIDGVSRDAWKDLEIHPQYDLPHDTLTEAQTAQALANLGISRGTWLKQISIVDDPRQEEKAMDAEHKKQIEENLDVLKSNHAVVDGDNDDDSQTGKATDQSATK